MSNEARIPKAGPVCEADHSLFFVRLFEDYSASIVAYFRRQGLPGDLALELAQETFLRAWKGLDSFRAESSRSTWLFTIARHVLLNLWRERQAQMRDGVTCSLEDQNEGSAFDSREGLAANPEGVLLSQERERLLRKQLANLPQQMRQCLELRLGDLKYREIAVILDISIETVKSHLYQARQRLRVDLEPYFTMDLDNAEAQ